MWQSCRENNGNRKKCFIFLFTSIYIYTTEEQQGGRKTCISKSKMKLNWLAAACGNHVVENNGNRIPDDTSSSSAIIGFLDHNYRYKSVATRILQYRVSSYPINWPKITSVPGIEWGIHPVIHFESSRPSNAWLWVLILF